MMAYGKDADQPRTPQWMRSMEEKYQRLHARVADHAARSSQSRNSLSVRLRELRQRKYHAQQRTQCKSSSAILKNTLSTDVGSDSKDQSPDRSMFVSSAVEFPPNRRLKSPKKTEKSEDVRVKSGGRGCKKRSSSATAWTTIPPNNNKTTISSNDPVDSFPENIPAKDADNHCKRVAGEENESRIKHDHKPITDSPNSSNNKRNDDVETKVSKEKISSRDKERMKETRPFSVPRIKNSKSNSNEDHSREDINRNITGENTNTHSRTSPHRKIYSKSAMPLLSGRQTEELRARLFSTMSQEAQHAKQETLKDMTSEDVFQESKREKDDDALYGYLQATDDIAEGYEPKLTKEGDDIDIPLKDFTEGLHLKPDISDKDSAVSSSSSDAEYEKECSAKHSHSVRQRLKATPYCDPGKYNDYSPKQHNNTQNLHVERPGRWTKDPFLTCRSPLPAISQANVWHVHRDNSFNITSPEFDVRFCRKVISSKEEREEPPEDIRRQSIEKCRLWLERQLGRL